MLTYRTCYAILRCKSRMTARQAKETERDLLSAASTCQEAESQLAGAQADLDELLRTSSSRPATSSAGSSSSRFSAGTSNIAVASSIQGTALASLAIFETGIAILSRLLHPLNMMLGMAHHGAGRAALAAAGAARLASAGDSTPTVSASKQATGSSTSEPVDCSTGSAATPAHPRVHSSFLPSAVQAALTGGVRHFEASLTILDAHYPADAPAPAFERLELLELLQLASPADLTDMAADAMSGVAFEQKMEASKAAAGQALHLHFGVAGQALVGR